MGGQLDMGIGTSVALIAVGAILDFAVTVRTEGFDINTVGLILLIVGAVGLVASLVVSLARRSGSYSRERRVVHDGADTYVEERGRY